MVNKGKSRPAARFAYRLLVISILSLWLVITLVRRPTDGLGTDFYPFYHTAQALMANQDPYSEAVVQDMMRVWDVKFASTGFVYPLPAAIGVWPILLLPLPLAIAVWTVLGAVGTGAAIFLPKEWKSIWLLPFCFMPFYHSIIMHQATLVWCAFAVFLVLGMRKHWSWLVALCIVLLPGKPQVGMLFVPFGLFWAWREDRRTLWWVAGWTVLIWGGTFAVQPTWVQDWLNSLNRHSRIGHTISMLPYSLILLVATWRLPWYARVAAAQVALFPASDVYTALPLLLCWVHIGGPLALIGAGISWLWLFADMPHSIYTFWYVMMIPLIVAGTWRMIEDYRTRRFQLTKTMMA